MISSHVRYASISMLFACGTTPTAKDAHTDSDTEQDSAEPGDSEQLHDSQPDTGAHSGADTDSPADTDPLPTFTVSGTLDGLGGSSVTILLNGTEALELTADGAFHFTTALPEGTPVEVSLASLPTCPAQFCELDQHTSPGIVADIEELTVTCRAPTMTLITSNWRDLDKGDAYTLRLTDRPAQYTSGATATPRIVAGDKTDLNYLTGQALGVDNLRGLLYVANHDRVLVFDGLDTLDGNTAPTRTLQLALSGLNNLVIDEARDRLYVSNEQNLYIVDDASTLDGAHTPVMVAGVPATHLALDPRADRLWVHDFGGNRVRVFDDASAMTSSTTADRSFRWTAATGFEWLQGIAIDPCTDRLYLSSNRPTPGGNYLVAFDGAAALQGDLHLDDDPVAVGRTTQSISLVFDARSRLYTVQDSARAIERYASPEGWSGTIPTTPDWTLQGAVSQGYGIAFWLH